jgi:hypothetical protein
MKALKKFASRKFLLASASTITGIMMIFGMRQSVADIVVGAIVAIVPSTVAIITQGKIDLELARKVINSAIDAVEELEEECK